jgi:hypothetical protein
MMNETIQEQMKDIREELQKEELQKQNFSASRVINKKGYSLIPYDLHNEMYYEKLDDDYHKLKNSGNWYYAKLIISSNYNDMNATEYLWDYMSILFQKYDDCFENINTVYYKSYLDMDIIHNFEKSVGKYLIENLKIPAYKPDGFIFSNSENVNKWSFKVVVITNKNMYCVNRYVSDKLIGCY